MVEKEEGEEIEEEGMVGPHTLRMTPKMKMNRSLKTNQRLLVTIARSLDTTQMNANFQRRTSQRRIKRN